MNLVTGCSGIDAIALAAYLLDIELIGQIEIDEFCNKILELRYPGVKRYKNIFDVRGDEFGAVDIFAAGIPCQPFSHAGKRKGSEDDRYLWPEAIRIIRVMQPTWIIIENVDGIGSMEQSDSEIIMETETEICIQSEMVLETIRRDLKSAGYQSIPIVIPAASVGAMHQRYRYFIVGHSKHDGQSAQQKLRSHENASDKWCKKKQKSARQFKRAIRSIDEFGLFGSKFGSKCCSRRRVGRDYYKEIKVMGDTECSGCSGESWGGAEQEPADGYSGIEVMANTQGEHERGLSQREGTQHTGFAGSCENVAYTTRERLQERKQSGRWENAEETGTRMELEPKRCSQDVANSECQRQQRQGKFIESSNSTKDRKGKTSGTVNVRVETIGTTQSGMGRNADGISDRLHEPGGYQDSSRIFEAFETIFTATLKQILWPAGYGTEQHDYEPPRVAAGVKNRTSSLKALGNAIVWEQIFPILLAIKLINA